MFNMKNIMNTDVIHGTVKRVNPEFSSPEKMIFFYFFYFVST